MSYVVKVTDEEFRPIASVVEYSDIAGNVVVIEQIPATEHTLDNGYIDDERTFGLAFKAPGYYDFDTDKYHLVDVQDITLQRKPTHTTEIVAGAAIVLILAWIFKK